MRLMGFCPAGFLSWAGLRWCRRKTPSHIERRIPMNLTETQTQHVVPSTAAKREDGNVERRKHSNPTDFVAKQPGRVQPASRKKSKDEKLQRSSKSSRPVSKQDRVIEMLQ